MCVNGMHKVGVIPKCRIRILHTAGRIVTFEIFVLHGKVHSRAKRLSAARRTVYFAVVRGTEYTEYGVQ